MYLIKKYQSAILSRLREKLIVDIFFHCRQLFQYPLIFFLQKWNFFLRKWKYNLKKLSDQKNKILWLHFFLQKWNTSLQKWINCIFNI